jgi:hypothetical protein
VHKLSCDKGKLLFKGQRLFDSRVNILLHRSFITSFRFFYQDLQPNVHYIPASLDNIAEVSSYVVDKSNDLEMNKVVQTANSWCEQKLNKGRIINDTMDQIELYFDALNDYMTREYLDAEWESFIGTEPFGDYVEC